jgi:hypothetical protein
VRWIAVIGLVACGRLDFDPQGSETPSDGRRVDGALGMDGKPGDGAPHDSAPPDAAVTACSAALVVTQGVRLATTTCVSPILVHGCVTTATKQTVFAFKAPATSGYNIAAYDPGTNNISNSVAQIDSACSTSGSCAGLLGVTLNANETAFFVVESAGGCASIEFEVM